SNSCMMNNAIRDMIVQTIKKSANPLKFTQSANQYFFPREAPGVFPVLSWGEAMRKLRTWLLLAGTLIPGAASGCVGPLSMGIATPIPVQPWVAESVQERIMNKN